MPKAQTADVYPSLVNITTDATGDLQEVTGAPASPATLSLYSGTAQVDLVSVESSANANNIKIVVQDNNGGTDKAEYDEDTQTVSVFFRDLFTANNAGTAESATYNGAIDLTAVEIGDLEDKLQFTVLDNVAGESQDNVKVNASDGDVTVCLINDITTYTNADIWDLLTNTAYSWVSALTAVMTPTQNAGYTGSAQAINVALTLQGGVNPSGQIPAAGTAAIVSLINGTAETAAIVTASGGDSTLPSNVPATNMANGSDLVESDLDFNSKYICIKRDDIHGLEDDETNDARKILWGMLESYVQFVTGQSAEQLPENFIATRGNPALLNDNAGVRIRQTYTINAFYGVGDFDLEDETDAN